MLRTPVTFEAKTQVADGLGGWTETWATIISAPTRAHVKSLSGSERLRAEAVSATTRKRVTCRYSADVDPGDRVLIGGRAHNIRFVNNIEERDRWMEIDVDGGEPT